MIRQADIDALNVEYKEFIVGLWAKWLVENRSTSRDVFEVMRPEEQAKVRRTIELWDDYITPLATAWWQERGYGVVWPKDNSEPMRVYKT